MSTVYLIDIKLSGLNLSGGEAVRLRHNLEDGLEQLGIGEVIGGGTMIDGSAIDIEFETNTSNVEEKLFDFFKGKNLEKYVQIRQG